MAQQRRIRRHSGLSKKQQQRLDEKKKKHDESFATKISRIAILIVLIAMIVALAYTVVLLSGYNN